MTPTFPQSVSVKDIDTKHPDIAKYKKYNDELTILYRGGKELQDNAARFLAKHSKELGTAFLNKLQKINYDSVLATVIGWYTSKLFERQLNIDFKDEQSETPVDNFYENFVQDCDRGGTTLELFFERVAIEVLLYGQSWFLTDLPKLAVQPTNLYEQQAQGGLDPYLVWIPLQNISNYQYDADGNLEWVLIHATNTIQSFLAPTKTVETWTYYDKKTYATYTAEYQTGTQRANTATLTDSGIHSMSSQNEVPVSCVRTDYKLWLGNRIYLPVVEYFNAYNSFGWSLWLANNPLPVLTDGQNAPVADSQTVSEYAFLKLPFGATFKWEEPQGHSWEASQKYLDSLREGIYRQCHLVAQGRSSRASATVASGVSKEADMQPAADVLNVFGNLIRNTIQDTLDDLAQIRGDATVFSDVRGMNFAEDGASDTVDLVIATRSLGIQSPIFDKEVQKLVIRAVLRDANQSLLQDISDEIDTAPDATAGNGTNPDGTPVTTQPTVALNITERSNSN